MTHPPHPASHETAPITAVLLAYEQVPVVEPAIRSIFNQTLQPAEIILSDDGSKDGTHAVMEKLVAAELWPPA